MAIVNSRAAIEPKTGKAAIFVNETIHSLMRKLFSNNEQGFFYDPNDLSTMYQDAAGAIPVTAAGQPVGLMLDKSKGLVLGAELITNGDFSNGLTGWTSVLTASGTANIVNGMAELSAVGANAIARLRNVITVNPNSWYKFQVDVSGNVSTPTVLQLGVGPGGADYGNFALATGKNTFYVYVTGSTVNIQFYKGINNGTVYLDNVSAKQVAGNHAYQTTSSMRPLLQNSPRKIDYDGVDDKLTVNLPAQLIGCTVIRSVPNVGTQILTGQTIPATYEDNKDHCGLIVINRALTPSETSAITSELNKRAGG